ncbi:hypothetical protein [Streptomyces griseosporeus]|uniref:hypothetical protein n=1 Tax=Streptomyces griseosporeus TaxID=1910 RepID=UPI00167CEF37|nr:hypothetical protein [Streptomyces griseosporeus]
MGKRIAGMAIALIALISFLVVGGTIVHSFKEFRERTNPWSLTNVRAKQEEELEWHLFHAEAYAEYSDEFTRLFESLEFKQAKNGAPMIRRAGEKSFKFVSKG